MNFGHSVYPRSSTTCGLVPVAHLCQRNTGQTEPTMAEDSAHRRPETGEQHGTVAHARAGAHTQEKDEETQIQKNA